MRRTYNNLRNLLVTLSLTVLSSTIGYSAILKLATNASYPPFISKNGTGDIIGYDADVIKSLCQDIKVKCIIQDTSFEALVPSLILGKYDAIFGGVSITPKRQKVVDFSQPIYRNAATIIVHKGSKISLKYYSIQGKNIGYQQGNTFPDYIKAEYGHKVVLKGYPSAPLAFQDLMNHRIDGVILDDIVAHTLLEKQPHQNYIAIGKIYSTKYFGIGSGIAIKKGNHALLKKLNTGLRHLSQNGTLKTLQRKWKLGNSEGNL
jgi:arginine transport system substrate-binding protein